MIRSGFTFRPRLRVRGERSSLSLLAVGLLGAGVAFAQPPVPPADQEDAEDATEVAEPAEATPTETPTAMRAPDEPGVRVEDHKRWTGGSDSLASAVEAYNGTAGGKQAPLTVEAVAAAIRRGFRDWDRITTAPYDWVLKDEEAPRGGRIKIIRLDPSSEVVGSKLFVEMNAPGAPTIFQFPIPEEESPAGPTLAEAANGRKAPAALLEKIAAVNRLIEQLIDSNQRASSSNITPVPLTIDVINAAVDRKLLAAELANETWPERFYQTTRDDNGNWRPDNRYTFEDVGVQVRERTTFSATFSVTLEGGGGGFSGIRLEWSAPDAGTSQELSQPARDRIAAALAAAADDESLPTATRLRLLRQSVTPGELSAERTKSLFDRLAAVRRQMGETAERRTALANSRKATQIVTIQGAVWTFETEDVQREWDTLTAEYDRFVSEQRALLDTLAELEAVVPDAAAARTVAEMSVEPMDGPRTSPPPPRDDHAGTILLRSVADPEGLRALIAALRTPAEPDGTKPEGTDPAATTRRPDATPQLLAALRQARPTTDALAELLLDAAGDENPEMRAAALEALAGID